MKIAVTYEEGQVFQHFGHTEQFKVYEVQDGKVLGSQVRSAEGSGHGALAGLLKSWGVDALLCGGIGGGARMALQEAGIAFDPALILFQTFTREGGYRVAAQLLALDVPADALICANDEAALGALTFLREQRVHVPRQVSLIGFDDSAICQATSPTLTSVNFHSNEAGQQAVRILHALIHNQSPAPEDMTSAVSLVIRNSTCALP